MSSYDQHIYYESLATDCETASRNNDSRKAYMIAKTLSRRTKSFASKSVRSATGATITDPEKIDERWVEHFLKVFGAECVDSKSFELPPPPPVSIDRVIDNPITIVETQSQIKFLGKNKGLGPDTIESEVIVAGHTPFALALNFFSNLCLRMMYVPFAWRGGRIINLYKGRTAS